MRSHKSSDALNRTHTNQSKIQGDLQILSPAALAWLQHVLELSWPASASIIQSGVQIHP